MIMKKRWLSLVLALVLCFCFFGCAKQEEAQEDSVLGCTVLYGKQYYAYRVERFALASDYSEKVTVYDEGVQLWDLLQSAEKTPLDEDMGTAWGYCVTFYDHASEKILPILFITVDGKLHDGESFWQLQAPDEILTLLKDAVEPTNIDAVTKN